GAHSGRGQVQRRRGSEATGPEEKHARVEQLELALLTYLGDEEMTLVAVALLGSEGPGRLPGTALVLPAVEPAYQGHHVAVAQVGEGLGCERGAHPGRAVHHDRPGLVGDPALDLELELAAG